MMLQWTTSPFESDKTAESVRLSFRVCDIGVYIWMRWHIDVTWNSECFQNFTSWNLYDFFVVQVKVQYFTNMQYKEKQNYEYKVFVR
jgi:hypothetical protein